MASFGRFTPSSGGVVETLSYTSPTLSLTQSAGTSPLTATIAGGGGVDGSGTANFVSKWSDTDTLTDSLFFSDDVIAKTIYGGADKGLYINFDENLYSLGNQDADPYAISGFSKIGQSYYMGDNANLNNSILISVLDNDLIIKTSIQNADKGLYIDFNEYTQAQATDIPIITGSYQQFPNALSFFYGDISNIFLNHNFYSKDGLSSLKFGNYLSEDTDGGGWLNIILDKGLWNAENSTLNWNNEEGFMLYNYSPISLNSVSGNHISNLFLAGSESMLYNQNEVNNFALKLDNINEVIKTQYNNTNKGLFLDFNNNEYVFGGGSNDYPNLRIVNAEIAIGDVYSNNNFTQLLINDSNQIIKTSNNGSDKGLYIDFANNIYALGFTETGFFDTEPVFGFGASGTTGIFTMGDPPALLFGGDLTLNLPETRFYININRTNLKNLTGEQIFALTGKLEGDIAYNVTTHHINYWNGTEWRRLNDSPA